MRIYGRKIKVVVNALGTKMVLQGQVKRSQEKGQANVFFSDGDEGKNVPVPIVASCLKHNRPYYWMS